jgi:hypothetical protein
VLNTHFSVAIQLGKRLTIVGVVEEYLKRESTNQEWVSLKLENGQIITINLKHCSTPNDNNHGISSKKD